VKGAAGFPEATRTVVIETMKDEGLFGAVLTPEEAAAFSTCRLNFYGSKRQRSQNFADCWSRSTWP